MWFRSDQSLVQDVNNLLYIVSTDKWKSVEVLARDNQLSYSSNLAFYLYNLLSHNDHLLCRRFRPLLGSATCGSSSNRSGMAYRQRTL